MISVQAQTGTIIESVVLKSEILGKNMKYSVYLPAGYNQSNRNYPVLYLLHGYSDDDRAWIQFGEIGFYADKAFLNGEATPMIIIMPDGQNSYYLNSFDGTTNYEDFFIKELMPKVEETYRIKGERNYRVLAGLSMGGFGALNFAIKYPNLFCASAPLSAAVRSDEEMINMPQDDYERWAAPLFGKNLLGKERLNATYKKYAILDLLNNTPADSLKSIKWYFDCGDDDFLIEGNMQMHAILKRRGIPHEFRVRDGSHNWEYWRTALPNVLKFLSDALHR